MVTPSIQVTRFHSQSNNHHKSWSQKLDLVPSGTSPGRQRHTSSYSPTHVEVPASGTPLTLEEETVEDFLARAGKLLAEYIRECFGAPEKLKVVEFASPDEIKAAFAKSGVELSLIDSVSGHGEEHLLEACRLTLKYSMRSNHELYFNQLYGRIDPVSLVGDWLVAAAHQNVHTFEAAPVMIVVETEMVAKLAHLWLGAQEQLTHDGLFCPGGSICNLYSMLLAKHRARPDSRDEGLAGKPPLVAFCSSESHYSYKKAAIVLGIGLNNLVCVPVTSSGGLDPEALKVAIGEAKAAGKEPFFVGATAGTTVIGAYDPFSAISEVCKSENLWMHVDAAWGGWALLSPATRNKYCQGIELADSLTFDPHKFMGQALQCAVFLTRHKGLLQACNQQRAAYLFQPDKNNTHLDIGDKTIMCGRKGDAFKLWLSWQHRGDAGWAKEAERAEALSAWFEAKVSDPSDPRFALALPRSGCNICFWVIPSALRTAQQKYDHQSSDEATREILHKVAPKVKDAMQKGGDAQIGFQVVLGLPNCFRIVLPSSSRIRQESLEKMLDRMSLLADAL